MLSLWPWFVSIALLVWFWRKKPAPFQAWPSHTLALAFVAKLLAGLGIVAIYTWYYTDPSKADVYRYFNDGMALADLYAQQPSGFWRNWLGLAQDFDYDGKYFDRMANWTLPHGNRMYNDNRIVIRIHALFALISDRSIWQHSLLFAWIGFGASYALGNVVALWFKIRKDWCILGILFFPSLWLWASAPLKEPMVLLGMAMCLWAAWFLSKKPLLGILGLLAGFALLWKTKFYVLAIALPLVPSVLLHRLFHEKLKLGQSVVLGFLILGVIYASYVHQSGKDPLLQRLVLKQNDFINLSEAESAGSLIPLERLEPNWASVIQTIPQALYNATLRPLPWQIRQPGAWLMLLENLFLLWVAFLSVSRAKGNQARQMLTWLYIAAFLLLLGLSTPVLGGLFRYKAPIWPLVWGLFLTFPSTVARLEQWTRRLGLKIGPKKE